MMSSQALKGERKRRHFLNGYEAEIPCLRCRKEFPSTDRRSVRHCDKCRAELTRRDETLGDGGEWA